MTRPPLHLAGAALAVAALAVTSATVAVVPAARGAAPGRTTTSIGQPPATSQLAGDARAGPDTAGMTRHGVASDAGPGARAGVVPDRAAPSASRALSTAAGGQRARWQWPLLPRPPVLRLFRAPATEYGRGHRGLDLAAVVGAPVLAVEGGVVTHAGVVAGRGTVTVRHTGGLSSTYEPVEPAVGLGYAVSVGDRLGTVEPRAGPGHCGARVCLHLGARQEGAYVDPHPYLVAGRVRLLPLD